MILLAINPLSTNKYRRPSREKIELGSRVKQLSENRRATRGSFGRLERNAEGVSSGDDLRDQLAGDVG